MHGDSFYWGWFYILFPLFWFCLLISPNWRPLRIDSKRRLIYFWSWGKFYIAQYPIHLKDNPDGLCCFLEAEMFKSWMHREAMGSLILHIPHENPEVQKKSRRADRHIPPGMRISKLPIAGFSVGLHV